MTFNASSLLIQLTSLLPANCSGLLVAFSGGLDSTVLLHALAGMGSKWPIRAVHINHNLHADAPRWSLHCEQLAQSLGIPYDARSVDLDRVNEEGIEAAARRARYAALSRSLTPNECLLTAHHADDQAETLLLALARGTGVRGLAAMPELKSFSLGWHARPLLPFTRESLAQYAREHSLVYLSDPANESERFARNHMRHAVLPALRTRWPDVSQRLARTAGRMAETGELLDELAAIDAQDCCRDDALVVDALAQLSRSRRNNVVRWWLRNRGARAPSSHRLEALWIDVSTSAADRVPHVDVDSLRVFRHGSFLYAERKELLDAAIEPIDWSLAQPIITSAGQLSARVAPGAGIKESLVRSGVQIRYRGGGEELQPRMQGPHRSLKKLLQEAHVLPWWRDRIPLIYAGEHLLSVADLWVDASAQADATEAGVVIEWIDRPRQLHAIR